MVFIFSVLLAYVAVQFKWGPRLEYKMIAMSN